MPARLPLRAAALALLVGCHNDRPDVDEDEDGFPAGEDCNDSAPQVYPGSHYTEVPGDGADQDCDGNDFCRDLNCDAWPDLVIAWLEDDDGAVALKSQIWWGSDEGFAPDETSDLNSEGAVDVEIDDLDEDGYLDIVFANSNDGSSGKVDSLVYWGSRLGYSGGDSTRIEGTWTSSVTVGDIDLDGRLDLVFTNYRKGDETTAEDYETKTKIAWGDGNRFQDGEITKLSTIGANDSAVGDFNGDGYPDVAVAQGSAFTTSSFVFWGTADGPADGSFDEIPSDYARGATAADIDQDGTEDLVLANWCAGTECDSLIFWGSADGLDEGDTTILSTLGASGSAVADIDQDGDLDVVFANSLKDGFDPDVESYVYWQTGGALSADYRTKVPCEGCRDVDVVDYNADGLYDLVFTSQEGVDGSLADTVVYLGTAEEPISADSVEAIVTGVISAMAFTPDMRVGSEPAEAD